MNSTALWTPDNGRKGGGRSETEVHLSFEDLSTLLAVITPRRLEILKRPRQQGPLSVRALTTILERDYKNVHADISELSTYISNNRTMIPNYGEKWRCGEAISTGLVESTVNEVVVKRMVKKQEMQ